MQCPIEAYHRQSAPCYGDRSCHQGYHRQLWNSSPFQLFASNLPHVGQRHVLSFWRSRWRGPSCKHSLSVWQSSSQAASWGWDLQQQVGSAPAPFPPPNPHLPAPNTHEQLPPWGGGGGASSGPGQQPQSLRSVSRIRFRGPIPIYPFPLV